MKKLICFHGFLGGVDSFDFLRDDYEVISLDLSSLIHLDSNEIFNFLSKEYDLTLGYSLLGYSFGARLAAEIFLNHPESFNSLIMLAGHLGLRDSELESRREIENVFVSKLTELSESDFSSYWNGLSLFIHDKSEILHRSKNDHLYFQNYALSKQPYLLDLAQKHKDKIHIFYGEMDTKYCDYARSELIGLNITYLPELGHRLLQAPNIIKKELGKIL